MNSQKTYSFDEAQKILENYCAYQERCHKDVRNKLKNMRMIPEVIDKIIVHLIDQNYLNEQRFAYAFVSGKFRIKKWGKKRLINELKQREISKYNINEALSQIEEDDYLNTLDALAKKRLSQIKETNVYKRKKKLADYLLYRGWESHLVYQKTNELTN